MNDPEVLDHLGEEFEDETSAKGQEKWIWKESTYIRRLRDGEGVTTRLSSATLLPKGLPQVQEDQITRDLADDAEFEVVEWGIDIQKNLQWQCWLKVQKV